MSHSSLLAVGLLATGPLSAPPPPPLVPPDWWQRALAALGVAAATETPTATATGMAAVESAPSLDFAPSPRTVESLAVAPVAAGESARRSPGSGAQMYAQRRAALAAGRLYTHLPSDSFAERWQQAVTQPTHQQWQQLLQQEAAAIAGGQGNNSLSVLLGDSLSQWFPAQLLPRSGFWLNQGISGENSQQVRQRLATLKAARPTTLYVMAGINDLRQGASDATILANLRAIVRELRQQHPGAQVVVQSLLPTRQTNLDNARIRQLNAALRELARAENVIYLHLHPLFAAADGQMRSELTTDGLHLNRQGYRVWQAALQAAEAELRPRRTTVAQR